MKLVKLTRGLVTKIDNDDFDIVNKHVWFAHINIRDGKIIHIAAATNINGTVVLLHNFIIGKKKGVEIDHMNGDSLDNRRDNLRFVTHSSNVANRRSNGFVEDKRSSSLKKRFRVRVGKDNVGYFVSEKEARRAYEDAFIKKYGFVPRKNNINHIVGDKIATIRRYGSMSKYKYVTFNSIKKTWRAQPYYKGERVCVDCVGEKEAKKFVDNWLKDRKRNEVVGDG